MWQTGLGSLLDITYHLALYELKRLGSSSIVTLLEALNRSLPSRPWEPPRDIFHYKEQIKYVAILF